VKEDAGLARVADTQRVYLPYAECPELLAFGFGRPRRAFEHRNEQRTNQCLSQPNNTRTGALQGTIDVTAPGPSHHLTGTDFVVSPTF